MDSEIQGAGTGVPSAELETIPTPTPPVPARAPKRGIKWIFIGPQGMRAGWSAAIYLGMFAALLQGLQLLAKLAEMMNGQPPAKASSSSASSGMTPLQTIFGEAVLLGIAVGFAAIMAVIEKRHLLDYNLRGPRRRARFLSGLVAGFLSLSALVGIMALGGWMHFGPVALHGWKIAGYAAAWAFGFLLVGLAEEGICRCYLQFTLTRGINFWWALGVIALMCASLLRSWDQEMWGVYVFALIGLLPCLWLELRKAPDGAFWQAAWATSTFFAYMHTSNHGENWIGIFGVAAIGFVFCASIWATGSAWWAIGCHAAWDWAETYFYGTADSGSVAKGHLLTTTPAGSAFWSGGTDGPEGSVLIVPVIALLLIAVLVQYRRREPAPAAAIEQIQPQP